MLRYGGCIRLWFSARWASHRAANDRATDFPQSKWSERKEETETVLVTYCCIINYSQTSSNICYLTLSMDQESGQGLAAASGSGFVEGCNQGVSWG